MIGAAFFKLFNFIANNPVAQAVAGVIAALAVFLGWLSLHDRKVRREANAKAEKKARKTADKIITKMEKKSDERIEKAYEAADAVTGDVTSDSLPDDTASILFGPERRG